MDWDQLVSQIESKCQHSAVSRDADLGGRTTYRVGGTARVEVIVGELDDLMALAAITANAEVSTLAVGRGSNLLVADAGFDGVSVVLGDSFDFDRVDGEVVQAGGARSLPVLARSTVAAGLTGFEWAVGVPGSVGGAVHMNAGGHGSEMAESLFEATVVDLKSGDVNRLNAEALDFGYRHSALSSWQVVASASLRLEPGAKDQSEQLLSEIVRWRRENQPGGQNAGSVFTNPPADSAGRLIDEAGCKGLRVGSARVSEKHANFIQADPNGSADDIWQLMSLVVERVLAHSGTLLIPETHIVGFEEQT